MNSNMSWRYYQTKWISLLFIILLRGCLTTVIVKQLGPTIVTTKYGKLRGSLVEFPKDAYLPLKPVEAYLGIPYAALRKNYLRFMPPTSPQQRWRGIHAASKVRSVCPQKILREKPLSEYLPRGTVEVLTRMATFTKDQNEDCLSLNLYVPSRDWNDTENLPVMVFVHGESYEVGTGNAYDGSVLASYGGVIVVTVNYRLGVLGFLSTGDSHAEGNYALLDLLAILIWVKENIASFGGDPSRVTIFGHGHGAALINLLMLSKSVYENDLFHNAILQSGSAFSTWATSIDPVRCTQMIAKAVNCSHAVNNSEALVNCFREKSVDDLVRSVPLTPKYYTCFAPSVGLDRMFARGKTLEELVKSRRTEFANKKIMFGLTKKEAYAYLHQDEIENGISEDRKRQFIRTYVQNVFKYHRQKIFEILEHEYTEWERNSDNFSRRDNIMDLISDGQYKAPLVKMAQEHSETADTFFYSFAYSTQSEDYPQWSGGVHGDELPYIFGAPLVGGLSPFPSSYNSFEKELSKFMMRKWTNFAKTGDPNLPENDGISPHDRGTSTYFSDEKWPKYNTSHQQYLHIGKRGIKVRDFYRGKQLALWLKLIPRISTPDDEASESHELENADNISTFDDPTRLISKFRSIFPSPPPLPPYTPPIPQSDTGYVTTQNDEDDTTGDNSHHRNNGHYGHISTPSKNLSPMEHKPNVTASVPHAKAATSSTGGSELSIVVVVGAAFLFVNLLVFAGIFYQRKRILKLRECETNNASDRNNRIIGNKDINVAQQAEGVPPGDPSPSTHISMNHKPQVENNPLYSAISKPLAPTPCGGYTYSALSQKSSSPMHNMASRPTNETSEDERSVRSGGSSGIRPPGPPAPPGPPGPPGSQDNSRSQEPDRSPSVENRNKHLARANHQVTSNNAITIV